MASWCVGEYGDLLLSGTNEEDEPVHVSMFYGVHVRTCEMLVQGVLVQCGLKVCMLLLCSYDAGNIWDRASHPLILGHYHTMLCVTF